MTAPESPAIVLIAALATNAAYAADAQPEQPPPQGIQEYPACYQSTATDSQTPQLKIRVIASSKPHQQAAGNGFVTFPSPQESFKVFIKGNWNVSCQDSTCWTRYTFDSTADPRKLEGTIVIPQWGHPGTVRYQIDDGAMIEQKLEPMPCTADSDTPSN